MKSRKTIILIAILASIGFGACSKKMTSVAKIAAYSSYEIVCMGVGHDGSQTLRVWGKGFTKEDAIEQAKKNAVSAIVFNGIVGTGECERRPLVTEVNARERYAKYFNPFFADGGKYQNFVIEKIGNNASRLEAKGSSIYNYGIIVTVDREGLRNQLERDGIIKSGLSK